MKYLQTIDTIYKTMQQLQDDIYNNSIKYVKKNKFNEKLLTEKLNCIEKLIHGCWIEKSDLEFLIQNSKIKILNKKRNKSRDFYLLNDKGKKMVIVNKININHFINNNMVKIIFEFQVDGDYLDFKHVLNINRTLTYEIDISNIMVCLLLSNPSNKVDKYENL